MKSDLTLGPLFKVKRGHPNLKVLITRLLLVLEVWNSKPAYRKSWAGNILAWSDLLLFLVNPNKRNGGESKIGLELISVYFICSGSV